MTHFPESPMYPPGTPYSPVYTDPAPLRTSGLAIASLVLGILGLVTCCLPVSSLLAVIFAAVTLPAINRQEVKGRGVALGGLILGIIGLLTGIGCWIVAIASPENQPVEGAKLSAKDRGLLQKMGVVEKGEEIELFYPAGLFSMKEGGTVITQTRLVVYHKNQSPQKVRLDEIKSIDYTPATNWFGEGSFVATLDNGKLITFTVNGQNSGDKLFHKIFKQKVTQAREAVGKSVTLTNGQADGEAEDEEDASPPAPRTAPKRPGRH